LVSNGQFDVVFPLKFEQNRKLNAKSVWLSWYGGARVFSTRELDAWIGRSQDLTAHVGSGKEIIVGLRKMTAKGRGALHYLAFPLTAAQLTGYGVSVPVSDRRLSDLTLADIEGLPVFRTALREHVEARVRSALEHQKRRVAVLFDGQNFLYAARNLGVSESSRVGALIQRIMSFHHVKLAKFAICWQADINGAKIHWRVKQAIESVPGLEIIVRPMKVIRNGGFWGHEKKKVDVDPWLIPELVHLCDDMTGLEGVVLVTGDGDYLPGLETTWLRQDLGGPKYVEVVSSRATLAHELLNHPGIRIRLLEDILKA